MENLEIVFIERACDVDWYTVDDIIYGLTDDNRLLDDCGIPFHPSFDPYVQVLINALKDF